MLPCGSSFGAWSVIRSRYSYTYGAQIPLNGLGLFFDHLENSNVSVACLKYCYWVEASTAALNSGLNAATLNRFQKGSLLAAIARLKL